MLLKYVENQFIYVNRVSKLLIIVNKNTGILIIFCESRFFCYEWKI